MSSHQTRKIKQKINAFFPISSFQIQCVHLIQIKQTWKNTYFDHKINTEYLWTFFFSFRSFCEIQNFGLRSSISFLFSFYCKFRLHIENAERIVNMTHRRTNKSVFFFLFQALFAINYCHFYRKREGRHGLCQLCPSYFSFSSFSLLLFCFDCVFIRNVTKCFHFVCCCCCHFDSHCWIRKMNSWHNIVSIRRAALEWNKKQNVDENSLKTNNFI